MNKLIFNLLLLLTLSIVSFTKNTPVLKIDWICKVKTSCIDCLKIIQCSWCETEKKCFSNNAENPKEFCQNNTIGANDFELSIEGNARCACEGEALEKHCIPPGAPDDGPECHGRGVCQCGRCLCNPLPDPEHPSKVIIGEYCEFDNFSCDGPRCNEGPYSINEVLGGFDVEPIGGANEEEENYNL